MRLAELVASYASRRRSRRQRLIAVLFGLTVYGVLVPLAMLYVSLSLDRLLGVKLAMWPLNAVLAIPLLAMGVALMSWAAWAQWTVGKGTPLPLAPTQKLVVTGPYKYCRNPILLGAALYYFGIALLAGSLTGLALAALIVALSALYVKLVEEKELELRFGEEYLRYKERTPFLVPRIHRRTES